MRPSQKIDIYEAALSGAQEVPPVNTAASGTAEVQLNTNTNALTWKVTYSGLSAAPTGGHIHGPAAPGANARVLIPFTDLAAQPVTGPGQRSRRSSSPTWRRAAGTSTSTRRTSRAARFAASCAGASKRRGGRTRGARLR